MEGTNVPIENKSNLDVEKAINLKRFKRINRWRLSKKNKEDKEKAIKNHESELANERKSRKKLKNIQIRKKKEEQLKIHREAKKLRDEHERKRLEIEKELEMKEKKRKMEKLKQEKAFKTPNIKKKSSNDKELIVEKEKNEVTEVETNDPLDDFMSTLEIVPVKRKFKRKANTQLSSNLKKAVDKIIPKFKKPLKIDKSEILGNESKYDSKDLVIKEEASWLDKMRAKKKEIKPVNHSNMNYNDFRKNFYIEALEITAMTDKEVEEYRGDALEGVKIRGKNCPRPIKKWSQCGLPDKVYNVLKKFEYQEPFPIQCQAIPCIMAGRDVIACAKTGSGKTLAFVLPMFRHILDQPNLEDDDGPIGLIISPTRELAKQIFVETNKFAMHCGLRVVCCHGGATVADQIADLKRGPEIIVATPGRMIDMLCVNSGKVTNTRRVTYLVLDEADRMFDMGFEPQIMTIIQNTRPTRQTVLFSATFPKHVESLVREIMIKPVEIVIGGRSVASNEIIQSVKVLDPFEKFNALLKILGENYYKGQILIFTDRQEAVDQLFTQLQGAGYFTLTLHGGMDQFDRNSMVQDFKNKTRTILIATSVAARGLDVKDLNLVINYTVPNHYEDYIHRIGRTGRAGKTGFAITFITPEEEKFAPDLLKALKLSKQINIPQKLIEIAEKFKKKVEKGEEKNAPSVRSSGSKGYKFDENEQYQQKMGKTRQEAVYGTSASQDVSQKDIEEKMIASTLDQSSLNKGKKGKKNMVMTMLDRQLAAAKAGAAAIRTTIKVTKETHSLEDVQALAQVAYRSVYIETQRSEPKGFAKSKAEAIAKSLSISQKLNKLGAGATPQKLAEAINQRQYCKKFVVNDYPQQARFKVTQKTTYEQVREFADVTMRTVGTFFAPGRNPAMGEEKLAVLIEGKTPVEVEKAHGELKNMAEEIAKASGAGQQGYGKYSVV